MADTPPKEVDFLAGYSKNRELNYEVKYLRKVLGQVDRRIVVPQSLDASSLRALLDDIEPAPKQTVRRPAKPLRFTIQYGIAYAAAFALVVAVFYGFSMYKPEVIDGGIKISSGDSPAAFAVEESPASALSRQSESQQSDVVFVQESGASSNSESSPQTDSFVIETAPSEPDSRQITDTSPSRASVDNPADNVGGAGISTLLLEYDGLQYRARQNDTSDPDYPNPVTLEILNAETHEIVVQLDIPGVQSIERCMVSDGKMLLISYADADVLMTVYDIDSPENPLELYSLNTEGSLVDAVFNSDLVYAATISDEPPLGLETVRLPHSTSNRAITFTSFNLASSQTSQKAFVGGAKLQFVNQGAQVYYTGSDASGGSKDFTVQIILDGFDIGLGRIS